MKMSPRLRTLALTGHVVSSVGWLGAVASFLVLGIAGLTSRDAQVVRSAYIAMNLIGQYIIVPLSFATLVTGLVQSLGTHWGLIRHYWVLAKFALTVGATILLLLHQFTAVAGAARRVSETGAGTLPNVGGLGTQLVADAGLAVVVLLIATTLSVYKPWGKTRFALRPQEIAGAGRLQPAGITASWGYMALIAGLVVTVIVLHLTGVIGGH